MLQVDIGGNGVNNDVNDGVNNGGNNGYFSTLNVFTMLLTQLYRYGL